jgi:hypothetical protein
VFLDNEKDMRIHCLLLSQVSAAEGDSPIFAANSGFFDRQVLAAAKIGTVPHARLEKKSPLPVLRERHFRTSVPSPRRGYALMMVLVFLVLFLAVLGVCYRHIAAMLRIESVNQIRIVHDQGCVEVLARAMALLESGLPPSNPFVCGATQTTSIGPKTMKIAFSLREDGLWQVRVSPAQSDERLPPMPDTFAVPP